MRNAHIVRFQTTQRRIVDSCTHIFGQQVGSRRKKEIERGRKGNNATHLRSEEEKNEGSIP
jgi:hypothetical protein